MKRALPPLTGIVLLLLSLTTLATAQEVGDANKVTTEKHGTFLAIPSKPMIIWDKHRRQFLGTIIGRNEAGITVLKYADNKEYHIKWDTLNPKLVPFCKGEITFEEYDAAIKAEIAVSNAAHPAEKPKPKTYQESEEYKKGRYFYENREVFGNTKGEWHWKDAREFQRLVINNELEHLDLFQIFWELNDKTKSHFTGPTYRSPIPLLKTIEIKDPMEYEKVSLRPEFERLGVRAQKQVGDTCSFYSMQHIMQYVCKKNGYPVPTVEYIITYRLPIIKRYNRDNGVNIIAQNLVVGVHNVDVELIKHQIRKGHPCIVWYARMEDLRLHASVAVGFETKDGKTSLQILDSNGVNRDGGYKWLSNEQKISAETSFFVE